MTPGDQPRCTDSSGNLYTSVHVKLDGSRYGEWTDLSNKVNEVKFYEGGQYTLCYRGFGDELYEAISPTLEVAGATRSDNKMWCPFDQVFECGLFLRGYNQPAANATDKWEIRIIKHDVVCEEATALLDEYNFDYVPFTDEKDSYEIHNIGPVRQLFENDAPDTFKICYCPGWQHDQTEGLKPCTNIEDFIQDVGYLIQTQVHVIEVNADTGADDQATLYPTLPFTLKLICGDVMSGIWPDLACSGSEDMRYKILFADPATHKPYYDESNKCRTQPQAHTFVSPPNCIGPSTCHHVAAEVDTPASKHYPKWEDVRIQDMTTNGISTATHYDVCYCDGNCNLNTNWFKFGSFTINTMSAKILRAGNVEVDYPVVNTDYFVKVHGEGGTWAGRSEPKSFQREMKIISDEYAVVDSKTCIESVQSVLLVDGHPCTSSLDCSEPESTATGQKYGHADELSNDGVQTYDIPGLSITKSGWVAVCYCDQHCNQPDNWMVAGRILIGGPRGGQSWIVSLGLLYDLEVFGYGLSPDNRIGLVKGTSQSCAGLSKEESINGGWLNPPIGEDAIQTVAIKTSITALKSGASEGVTIVMKGKHNLVTGDMIDLSGVQVKVGVNRQGEIERMFNRNHQISVVCDDDEQVPPCHEFRIPIYFTDANWKTYEIPTIEITWLRNSQQLFQGAKGNVPATFTICWSESETNDNFVGQAGVLTVAQPDKMDECRLGLTSLAKDVMQPILIHFRTSGDPEDRFSTAKGSTRLKIVFDDLTLIKPAFARRMVMYGDLPEALTEDSVQEGVNTLEDMDQPTCGLLFLELFSSDEYGFPVPKGCYFSVDKSADRIDETKWIWEFFIVFNEGNGLTEYTDYEIVMNVVPHAGLATEGLQNFGVNVVALDDVVENPFNVFEYGRCDPTVQLVPFDVPSPVQLLTGAENEKHAAGFVVHSSLTQAADTVDDKFEK